MNFMKKTRKKIMIILLGICIMCSYVPLQVNADAIWEPSDDFYWNHTKECTYVGTDYLTNGKDGYVNLYKEPGSDEVVATIKNGKRFYVGFSWTDKEKQVWAVMSLWNFTPEEGEMIAEENMDAWLPMEDLARLYNEADFRADYEDTFEEYTDEMAGYEIKEAVYLWEYPGSEKSNGWIQMYEGAENEPVYDSLYTDPDGRRWTHIGYYYGHGGWLCIDDPENKNLTSGFELAKSSVELYPAALPGEMQTENGEVKELKMLQITSGEVTREDALGIAGAGVTALVAVTAVLIAVLFGKKKKDKGEK